MQLGGLLVVFSLLTLSLCQSSDDTCKCSSSVVVMTKEELRQEIQAQAITGTAATSAIGCDFNVSQVTDELYARVLKLDTKKLVELQEAINCPCETASSCKDMLRKNPHSPSGYYWLRNSPTTSVKAYCDFTTTFGGARGGWTKVAELDMTNSMEECPEGFVAREHINKNLCEMNHGGNGCPVSVFFKTHGIPYSEVYGRVIAYQKGQTDGIHGSYQNNYLDGVSLTHGPSLDKKHIWSFIATKDETGGSRTCPCTNRERPGPVPPRYVGQDYFCDTGTERYQNYIDDFNVFEDPLWDGAGCGPLNDCCQFNNPPWFYKKLPYSTTDDIEMRVCRNGRPEYENVFLEKIDIYTR